MFTQKGFLLYGLVDEMLIKAFRKGVSPDEGILIRWINANTGTLCAVHFLHWGTYWGDQAVFAVQNPGMFILKEWIQISSTLSQTLDHTNDIEVSHQILNSALHSSRLEWVLHNPCNTGHIVIQGCDDILTICQGPPLSAWVVREGWQVYLM